MNLIVDPGDQSDGTCSAESPPGLVDETRQEKTAGSRAENQVQAGEKTGERLEGRPSDLEEMVSWENQPATSTEDELFSRLENQSGLSLERLEAIAGNLHRLQETVETTAKHVTFIPPQVRMLTNKIDAIATTLNESRYQALLLRLLGIYDLVCGMQRGQANAESQAQDQPGTHTGSVSVSPANDNLEILRTQIVQVLEANGLQEIPTDGSFDPQLHYVVGRLMVKDPALDGAIIDVVRPGFQTEASVLRFAEVRVGYYPNAVEDE